MLTIEDLIAYLDTAEGSSIHKNKTESDVTAFYGVYRKYHSSFEGWHWLDDIAEIFNLDYRNNYKDRKELNHLIQTRDNLRRMYNEYSELFHKRNMKKMHLGQFPSTKTALTYFSLTTNAGKKRATKVLQESLNNLNIRTTIDGDFGPNTLKNLLMVVDARALNEAMLKNMQRFYDRLIARNPDKYAIYKNGWTNRLNSLR